MASLRKIPGCKNWIACITLPNGRQTQRGTGTTDRRAALKIAFELEEASRAGKAKRLTEARARRAIASIYEIANQESLPSSSVREFFDSWLARKRAEVKGSTLTRYEGVKSDFIDHLGPKVDLDVSRLTARDIVSFRDALTKRVSAPSTNIALKIVRSALAQAKRDQLIDTNVAELVGSVEDKAEDKRRPLSLPELKRILKVANDEWRSMILFGLYTGQRLGDIARLRWNNIDLETEQVVLQTGKTGRRQILPMAKPLLAHVESLDTPDKPSAPLFPRALKAIEGSKSENSGTLSNQFYRILVSAGLAAKRHNKSTGKGRDAKRDRNALSFHSLRHTTTSLLKNAGTNDAVARDIVGHESAAVSANYTHIDEATKRKALNTLPTLS